MIVQPVDLAIIGGGCAGLSLARDISHMARGRSDAPSVVVLEPRLTYQHDRTWCFWATDTGADETRILHSWPAWRFSAGETEYIHRAGGKWAYHCIPSDRFYQDALSTIRGEQVAELRLGVQVAAIESVSDNLRIETNAGTWLAKQIVDTRPPAPQAVSSACLVQAFAGVEIEAEMPVRELEVAGLMEAMRCDNLGFRFDYVLPLTPTRLLIEATRFSVGTVSANRLSADLQSAVDAVTKGIRYQVIRKERGAIPMGLPPAPSTGHPRWVRAGTGGGAVRAASGYAYRRIQAWSRRCATSLLATGQAMGHPPESVTLRWMDRLFLAVLRNHPERAPEFFMALARRVDPAAFVRFLTDQPRPTDLLSVVRALPSGPFLAQWQRNGWQQLQRLRSDQSG